MVDLAFDRVDGAHPHRAIAFLHGILGRGINLRTIGSRFVAARPHWTAWLVDLRGHGKSPKGSPAPSLEAAARDVVNLAGRSDLPLRAIVGHSFGGKVALEAARLDIVKPLEHIVTIDSAPGAMAPTRSAESALAVIDTVESLPREFASKSDFVRTLVAAGTTRTVADWLAGSLERENDQLHFSLDLTEVRALLLDYFACDLWPVVEQPPAGVSVHLLIADRSSSYTTSDRQRALQIAASSPQVTAEVLTGGHWLHADNPDGVLSKLLDYINK